MAVTSYRQGWESEFWFIGSDGLEDIDFNILYVSIDFNSVPQYLLWSIDFNGDERPFEPHEDHLSNAHLIIENIYSSQLKLESTRRWD